MSEKITNNYELQTETARELFVKWDQKKLTSRNGIDWDDNYIYVHFFQNRYSVNRLTGEVLFCEKDDVPDYNAVMVIYDVLCNSKPGATLSRQWQTLVNLNPHSNFGSMEKSLFNPAAEAFSGKIEELKAACTNLGGLEMTKADAGFLFNIFPFLPMVFQFWDGDDEFAPRVSFLYDSSTEDFICFESAFYVAGHLVEIIRAEMDAQFSMGFYGR
jgi:hypothetical protein